MLYWISHTSGVALFPSVCLNGKENVICTESPDRWPPESMMSLQYLLISLLFSFPVELGRTQVPTKKASLRKSSSECVSHSLVPCSASANLFSTWKSRIQRQSKQTWKRKSKKLKRNIYIYIPEKRYAKYTRQILALNQYQKSSFRHFVLLH